MTPPNKKTKKLPHVFVLLAIMMLVVTIMSWIIPSGKYPSVVDPVTGVTSIDPDGFAYIEQENPISIMDFFTAMHNGVVQSGNLIVTLFFSAGMIGLVESSGAIRIGVEKLIRRSKGKEIVIVVVLHGLFTALGAVGMAEGVISLIPICVSVIMALGYDRMLGYAAAGLGLCIGFTSGLINIYTTGTAQQIVGLPLFSGIAFRAVGLAVFFVATVLYLMGYAKKIKRDPTKSCTREEYMAAISAAAPAEAKEEPLTQKHIIILLLFAANQIIKPFGGICLGWGMPDMNAINLVTAVLIMLVLWQDVNVSCRAFIKGSMGILPAALTIGLSRAIVILMDQGQIIDTIINSLVQLFSGKSPLVCIILVYVVVVGFNCLVTSGSGKAVILMPILGPLGQLLNINQQVMVHTYLYGDGFTNYFWPTSGSLMAGLELAEISWGQWVKFSWKIMVVLSILSLVLIGIAQTIALGPF